MSDRGNRAALRRAESPLEFARVPPFHTLRTIVLERWPKTSKQTIALIASVLSRVDATMPLPLGRCLAAAGVNESRLRRFLTADTRETCAEQPAVQHALAEQQAA